MELEKRPTHHKKQTTDFTETTYIPKNNGKFISDDVDSEKEHQNKKKAFKAFIDPQIVNKSEIKKPKKEKNNELENEIYDNIETKKETVKRRNNVTIENKLKLEKHEDKEALRQIKKERILKLIDKKIRFDNERRQKSKLIKSVAINISFYKNLEVFYTPEEIFLYHKYKPALLSVRILYFRKDLISFHIKEDLQFIIFT